MAARTLAPLVILTSVAVLSTPPAAHADEPPKPRSQEGSQKRDASAQKGRLTTEDWTEPEPGFTAHWHLLRVPEMALRLAFTPLFPLIAYSEDVRLDNRVMDLVTNEEHTRLFVPVLVAFNRDGFGAGFLYSHSNLFGAGEKLELSGLVKTNLDREATAAYAENVSVLDGRSFGGRLEYELDQNERYHGIGPDTSEGDRRALEIESVIARFEIDAGGPNTFFTTGFGSEVWLGYRREALASGEDSQLVSLGRDSGDTVRPPPGFGEAHHYADLRWSFSYDQRDGRGRTHRGLLIQLALDGTSDLDDANLNAAKGTATTSWFVPVAPRHRVLVLHGGIAAAAPLGGEATVPLHALVSLGRSTYLRGYTKRRFRDRSGWWSSIEYRYPIFDFEDTGAGLSSTLFFDVGGVARAPGDVVEEPVRYSPGLGVRAETSSAFVFRAQIAFSPEGIQAAVSLNEHYEEDD